MIEIVSGPCSAESGEQVFATASALRLMDTLEGRMHLRAFRAGLWKPRTRPGSFEGVGEKGFPWLKDVQQRLGYKVMVEVGTPSHVEAALKAGMDMLWIGARTTTNPFDVQAIADALRGTDIPVFVKNPINPDVDLWVGAVERLFAAGITDISTVHRGFSYYEKSRYRNYPKWQVPIDVMQMLPDVPMYCDPSHIGGSREYLREISQKALDLGFKGLFVESHISPDTAKSDALQQVTPQELVGMLSSLVVKDSKALNEGNIALLRAKIDTIDDNLLDVLAERMKVVEQIGEYKRANKMQVFQQSRWEEVQSRVAKGARARGLDADAVGELFKIIHQASIERQ